MAYLKINKDKLTESAAKEVIKVCPFNAIEYNGGELSINSGCKMCRLCVKRGPAGLIEYVEEALPGVDKSAWKGIAVYAEHAGGRIHGVTLELLGKAKELAAKTSQPVCALVIGHGISEAAKELLKYGADCVYIYDYPELGEFKMDTYVNAFEDFIHKVKPSTVMVGATALGRSLAPRVAARFRTGLTADCTMLEMRENTDLVQIRPAFGGNIMAQIITPRHRPQFCTVRYKVFALPEPMSSPQGKIVRMDISPEKLRSVFDILSVKQKPREVDISEADIIVAVGRGIKTKADMAMIEEFAEAIGARTACTRPLIECGWFDAKRQIGLSGRTVKAKLIITAGVSGSVQFAAGMQGSECIVAINKDPAAPIFGIAHYGLCGDLYTIIPALTAKIKEERSK